MEAAVGTPHAVRFRRSRYSLLILSQFSSKDKYTQNHSFRVSVYATRIGSEEFDHVKKHVEYGVQMLGPVGGPLSRVIPIILAHHDKFNGKGYHPKQGDEISLAARILSVADAYDAMTSDQPYRKAMSTFEAKETVLKLAGTDFDPNVVDAFVACFRFGMMEVPEVMI